MLPEKKVTRYLNHTQIEYRLPDNGLHREDGPALIVEYDDGRVDEAWYFKDHLHRYGGPCATSIKGTNIFCVYGKMCINEVEEWLSEHGYVWETMSDIEKWELELFMRCLG